MEWMAPKENFYALYAAIRNPKLNSTKALAYLGLRELEKVAVKAKGKGRKKTELDMNKIIDLYINHGLTQRKVALILGTSQTNIGNKLKEYGIKSRNRGGK